jgi:hypothetical protein
MKKLLITIVLGILAFSELSAQNNYYWSGGNNFSWIPCPVYLLFSSKKANLLSM